MRSIPPFFLHKNVVFHSYLTLLFLMIYQLKLSLSALQQQISKPLILKQQMIITINNKVKLNFVLRVAFIIE